MSSVGTSESKVIISDTTCLVILQKIDAFEILHRLYPQTMTTPEVRREFGAGLPNWIAIQSVQDIALMEAFKDSVDTGEASAIALAMETPNSLVIVDDLKGRNLAKRMGLDFMGTLGMLLKAKEHGVIAEISPYVIQIQQTNFRVFQAIIDYVLEQARE
jgi:predicted nucleic acid-binding protein